MWSKAVLSVAWFILSLLRYFSVTRPLTYRAKRTTKRAMTMIGLAWSISFILWAPAILFWQYLVGERTVKPNECYIQFLSEPIITFCTAIAAFYLPVTIMAFLFWKIYQETEKRAKDVQSLKGSGSGNSPSQAQTQKNMSAITRQMSSGSSSSYEIDHSSSEKNNEVRNSRQCCHRFCFRIFFSLPGCCVFKKIFNASTATIGKTEQYSCDNNEGDVSREQSGSEVETDQDSSRSQTGWTLSYCLHITWIQNVYVQYDVY